MSRTVQNHVRRSALGLAMAVAVGAPNLRDSVASARPTTTAPAPTQTWLDSLDAGYLQAQKSQRPMLVLVAETRTGVVPRWTEALADPAVAPKLGKWILVRLGPEAKEARRQLGIATTPALRAVSARGASIAACDTLPAPTELAAWLDAAATKASPSAKIDGAIAALAARLGATDAESREAAARQLSARRAESASAVIDVLAGEDPTARITAADVLEGWHAPMDGIDPWQRTTVTDVRLKSLRVWAASQPAVSAPTTAPAGEVARSATGAPSELDALLAAGTNAEARAVRERMVRFGESILPLVHQRLRETRSEQTHFRLTSLRYRLVATDALASSWPGGFDRLAAADTTARRGAVDELGQSINADNSRLLLELFGDDDPLVREKALHLLKKVRGPQTNQVLIRLLSDPEANVRAAVLKSLAEDEAIDPGLADDLVKYISTEKDPDLVIHAVHVLRTMQGPASANCLISLLSHAEWRVRAEAAEVLSKKLERSYGEDQLPADIKARGYLAVMKLLEDDEGFVVSRAIAALSKSQLTAAVDPMMRAIERHPEMATEVVRTIASDNNMSKAALPKLKPLMKSPRPELRAAAIKTICHAGPDSAQAELTIALADVDASVRAAGLEGVLTVMASQRPNDGYVTRSSGFLGMSSERVKVDVGKWLDDYRAGKGRYKWLAALQPTISALSRSETGAAKLNAAIALGALGQDAEAMPILLEAAKLSGNSDSLNAAFGWLPWESRKKLFDALIAANDRSTAIAAAEAMAEVPDRRAADAIWALLTPDTTDDQLKELHRAIR